MIDINKLKAVDTIVVHTYSDGACADGLAAELILRDVLPDAKVVLAQYGKDDYKNLLPRSGVLFCDIPPYVERDKSGKMTELGLAQARAWVDAGALVIEHHKGAADLVAMFGENAMFADEKTEPGVSAAVLAYRLWYRKYGDIPFAETVRKFARLAGIYDTWQKQDADCGVARAQAFALRFWPRQRVVAAGLGELEMLRVGEVLVEKHDAEVERVARGAHRLVAGGKRVAVFQTSGTEITNDVAEFIGNEVDVSVAFSYEAGSDGPRMRCSCRSKAQEDGTVFDCDKFAKQFKGGGHSQAAGFSVMSGGSTYNPYSEIERMFWGYVEDRT
jgi:hypothetical protein